MDRVEEGTAVSPQEGTGPAPASAGSSPSSAKPAAPPAGGAPSPITHKFAYNTLIVFLNAIVGQFLGWIATKLLFVHEIPSIAGSGAADPGFTFLGIATFYILLSSMVYTLGDLRLGTAYQFFVARGGNVGYLTGAYLLFRVASLGIVAAAIIAMVPLLVHYGLITVVGNNLLPLALFMLLPLLQTPSYIYSALMACRGKAGKGTWPMFIENGLRSGLLATVAFLWTWNPSVAGTTIDLFGWQVHVQQVTFQNPGIISYIAWAYIIAASVAFAALLAHSVFSAEGLFRHVKMKGALGEIRNMFVFATPLIGAMFLTYAVAALPPLFVIALLPNPQYLQSFAAANAFLLLLMFLPNAITVPLFPDMASLFVRGEYREMRRRTRKSLRWTVLILAPAIVAAIVFRRVLLNDLYNGAIITPGPYDAEFALALLSISVLPQALFRITGSVLDAVGQQKRELYLSTVQLVVLSASLVGFLWFTSPLRFLGITGAALAVLLSMTAGFLSNAWFLHRYVQVHPSPRPYITIFVAAAATFLLFSQKAMNGLGSLFGDPDLTIPVGDPWVLGATVIGGVILYGLILAGVGELTKDDVLELGGSLGLPRVIPRFVARLCWRSSWPDPPGDDLPLPGVPARASKTP